MPKRKNECEHDGPPDSGAIGLSEDSRTIYLFGPIEEARAANFVMALDTLNKSEGPIRIQLSSPGGEVAAGYVIYDAIKLSPNPVLIEGTGQVYSMAVLILQAGDCRMLTPTCDLMVHDIRGEGHGTITLDTMGKMNDSFKRESQKYMKVVAKASGIPIKQLKAMCEAETYLTATQAVKLGLADGIITRSDRAAK